MGTNDQVIATHDHSWCIPGEPCRAGKLVPKVSHETSQDNLHDPYVGHGPKRYEGINEGGQPEVSHETSIEQAYREWITEAVASDNPTTLIEAFRAGVDWAWKYDEEALARVVNMGRIRHE